MAVTANTPSPGCRWRRVLPGLAMLGLGLYFRGAHLGARPLAPEEGLHSLANLVTEGTPQPPLYYLLLRLWAYLVGDTAAALRSFSAVAGLLAIPLGYWLVRELLGSRRAAGLAAALIAVSPLHVLESREAGPQALGTAVVLCSCLALARALQRDRRRDWALYDLSVAAGMYTHFMFIPALAAQGVWLAIWMRNGVTWPWRRNPAWLRYWKAAVGGLLAFLPWATVMVLQRWGPAAAPLAAGGAAQLAQWLPHMQVLVFVAASIVVAWLLAEGCASSVPHRRWVSRAVTAALLLFGVVANAALGWTR